MEAILKQLKKGRSTASTVALVTAVDLATTIRWLNTLTEKGWVEKTRLAGDIIIWSITPAGREASNE